MYLEVLAEIKDLHLHFASSSFFQEINKAAILHGFKKHARFSPFNLSNTLEPRRK